MLTRSGLGAAVVAAMLVVCGLWWRYEELVAFGVAVGVAVLLALWSARGTHRATIARSITSPRVARGDPLLVIYRARNATRRRSPAAIIVDRCGNELVRVSLPPIPADDRTEVDGLIPTRRRGVFTVGPWTLERVDPFGLAIGQRRSEGTSTIIVHPRLHALHGPYGPMHTVEEDASWRRSASDPLSGFVSLREYVDGDDPRMIHWPTTARMGTLMLREHVELRRPEFTVVLDASASVADEDDFEEMVDVAASVSVHALRSGVEVMLRTTAREFSGSPRLLQRDTQVLDFLTPVTQASGDDVRPLPELFRLGFDHTTVVLITGPNGPSSTMVRIDRLSMVRIGRGAEPGPGVTLAARDAAEFVQRWRPAR